MDGCGGAFEQEALCCVCIDLYTDPVSLDCEHTVCRPCAARLLEFDGLCSPSGALRCPQCRAETDVGAAEDGGGGGVASLKPNAALRALSDRLRAERSRREQAMCGNCEEVVAAFDCEDCGFPLCVPCRDGQHAKGGYRRHRIHPLGTLQRLRPRSCPTHLRELDLYDAERNEVLCIYCLQLSSADAGGAAATGGSGPRRVIPLADAVRDAKAALADAREKLQAAADRVGAALPTVTSASPSDGADATTPTHTPATSTPPRQPLLDSDAAAAAPDGDAAAAAAAASPPATRTERAAIAAGFARARAALAEKEALLNRELDAFEKGARDAAQATDARNRGLAAHMRAVLQKLAEVESALHHADLVRARGMIVRRLATLADATPQTAAPPPMPLLCHEDPLEQVLRSAERITVAPPPPPPPAGGPSSDPSSVAVVRPHAPPLLAARGDGGGAAAAADFDGDRQLRLGQLDSDPESILRSLLNGGGGSPPSDGGSAGRRRRSGDSAGRVGAAGDSPPAAKKARVSTASAASSSSVPKFSLRI